MELSLVLLYFFFNDTATTEIYTLSLHDALPIFARVDDLTPGSAPPEEQVWHTYPPVEMPSAEGVIAALTKPETWPDYASPIGRFTPLRPGGLAGQTFEIEVAAVTESGRPVFTRGYVTITDLVTPDDPKALEAWFAALEEGLARYGEDEPRAVPEGGQPLVGFDLTTHQGHFMGNGHNRLLLYTHEDQDRKSTRLNSSHANISYAVFCLKK